LINAIGRLSRKLRERIGESLTTLRASEPLPRVTTGSLEALRKYSAGRLLVDAGEYERAISLLKEAIALDTGFAMAYRKLGAALDNSSGGTSQILAAGTKAFVHRDRLPDDERQLVTAWYYDHVDRDVEKVVSAYRAVLERHPDNTLALNNLSFELIGQRRWVEAESLAQRMMVVAPLSAIGHVGAAEARSGVGRYADAVAALDRFPRPSPSNPLIRDTRASIMSAQGDHLAAERELRLLRQEQHSSPSWGARTSYELALVSQLRGLWAEAQRHLGDYMAASEERGLARDYLIGAIELGWLDLRSRNGAGEAIRRVEAALGRYPLGSIPAVDRPYVRLAALYAEARHVERAKGLLAEFETMLPDGMRRGIPARFGAAGAIALAEGRLARAIEAYRQRYADGYDRCQTCGLYEMAIAFERSQQPDSALDAYQRIVSTPRVELLFDDYRNLPPTYKRLGELYEGRGDRAKAIEYYGRFIDLWKGADPKLQPQVAEARAALRRLGGA
jgi:tetratricopeptide (TPR) repeat protein